MNWVSSVTHSKFRWTLHSDQMDLLIYKKKSQQNIYNYSFWIFNYFNFYVVFFSDL